MEPPFKGNGPSCQRNVNPSQHFDNSTRYRQSSYQILDPQNNSERIFDNLPGPQKADGYLQGGHNIGGEYNQGEVNMNGRSPLPTESSWATRYGYWTPQLMPKRGRSPFSMDQFPNKRPRAYDPPPPLVQLSMYNQRDADGYWNPQQNRRNVPGHMHPSSTPSLSQRGYDLHKYDSSGCQNSQSGYERHAFTPQGTIQSPRSRMNSPAQASDQRNGPRAQTVAPEARRNYQNTPSRMAFLSSSIEKTMLPLQSPIWVTNSSRKQFRQSEGPSSQPTENTIQAAKSNPQPLKSSHQAQENANQRLKTSSQPPKSTLSTTQTLQDSTEPPRKGNAELAAEREWPFDDGGFRGDGGSSSDENMMLEPEVEGYNVHEGGFRQSKAKDPEAWLKPPSGEYKELQGVYGLKDLYSDVDRRQRRRDKLSKRDFKARWVNAQLNGDIKTMQKLDRQARRAKLPLKKVIPGCEDAPCTSIRPQASQTLHLSEVLLSAPRCEYHIRYPSKGAVVPFGGEQAGQSQYPNQESLKYATENHRSRSQSLPTQTPNSHDGGRFENQDLHASGSQYTRDHSDFQTPHTSQDATPWEETFRKSQQNSQQTNVDATLYRADDILPKASIPFNERANPGDMNEGHFHLAVHAYSAKKGHVGGDGQAPRSKQDSLRRLPVQGNFQTPLSQTRRQEASSEENRQGSPEIIDLCSSADNTPTLEPFKPMRDRISPPSKIRSAPKQSKLTSTTPRRSKKDMVKEQIDPERARQQRAANIIVAAELRAAKEDFEEQLFGAKLGLSPEEEEALTEAKRKEVQRKEEAKLLEEIAKQEALIEKLKKEKEITELREKERLLKEREKQNKKWRREQRRREQLANDAIVREAKRKQAAQRIEADRAKAKAETEVREKENEKGQAKEYDKLRIKLLKKDLEVKALQAASLSASKVRNPDVSSKNPILESSSPVAEDDDSLFVAEASKSGDVDMADAETGFDYFKGVSFRSLIAGDREKLEAEKTLEAKKKADATRLRLDAFCKSADPLKEKPKQLKRPHRSRSTAKNNTRSESEKPQNAAPAVSRHSIADKRNINSDSVQPKQSNSILDRLASVPMAAPPAPKIYSSEIRFITEVECEEIEKKRKIQEELAKQKRLVERRTRELLQIATRQRSKILTEAQSLGITLNDQEVDHRVQCHMKKLERAYQRKQAKKALKSGIVLESLSFDSNLKPQSLPGASAQSGSLSQPEIESLQTELPNNSTAAKRDRNSRYTTRTVQDLAAGLPQSDPESDNESEEDPDADYDKTLEDLIATAPKNGETRTAEAGAVNSNDRDTQSGDAMQGGKDSQRGTTQPLANPSNSKPANSGSQKPNQEEDQKIKIYKIKTKNNKEGEKLDESIYPKMLTDRDEANDMASEILKQLRNQAAGEEQSYSRTFKDDLYCGTVVFDDQTSMTVEVFSQFSNPSKFGLDVAKMNNRYDEKVWVIKQEIKTTGQNKDGTTVVTHSKEDVDDLVYTDRMYANHKAAEALVAFIKPPESSDPKFEEAWANDWSLQIRQAAEAAQEADEVFELEIERSDIDDAVWIAWDSAKCWVEVRKTAGPRN